MIGSPVDRVWAVVSDPHTHPDWWPDVVDVRVPEGFEEGGEYTRVSRRMGFLDVVDAVWVAEPVEQLKQARFRCTLSGTYINFALTPAQADTFIEAEAGMIPTNLRWQLMKAVSGRYLKGWVQDVLDALPEAVQRASAEPQRRS